MGENIENKHKYRELIELKGLIREKRLNYNLMAQKIGISISAFSNKINGKTVFTLLEALDIISILEIDANEISKYFF